MKKTGFVGFGNMGGTMLTALMRHGAFREKEVALYTRTREKLKAFSAEFPGVEVSDSLSALGKQCERVFICTGTREVKAVLTELAACLPENAHVISITGTIELKCLESVYSGKITKVMPTMISEVGEGVTLVFHNSKVPPMDRTFIQTAFGKIGRVKEIQEDQIDLAADLTSCAPAFFAAILKNFTLAAEKHGNFNEEELKELILPTCFGTAKLLMETQAGFDGLISRVATRGGITEEGIKILDSRLPAIFDQLLTVTLNKRQKTKQAIRRQYGLE